LVTAVGERFGVAVARKQSYSAAARTSSKGDIAGQVALVAGVLGLGRCGRTQYDERTTVLVFARLQHFPRERMSQAWNPFSKLLGPPLTNLYLRFSNIIHDDEKGTLQKRVYFFDFVNVDQR
jgi:hypothetical protein